MALVELMILFSSVYVAGMFVLGSLFECDRLLGPVAPKAALVAVVSLTSLIAMGLYQFHQRLYFREAVVRIRPPGSGWIIRDTGASRIARDG